MISFSFFPVFLKLVIKSFCESQQIFEHGTKKFIWIQTKVIFFESKVSLTPVLTFIIIPFSPKARFALNWCLVLLFEPLKNIPYSFTILFLVTIFFRSTISSFFRILIVPFSILIAFYWRYFVFTLSILQFLFLARR